MDKKYHMTYWAMLVAGWKVVRRGGELCILTRNELYTLRGFEPFYNAYHLHQLLQTPGVEVLNGR